MPAEALDARHGLHAAEADAAFLRLKTPRLATAIDANERVMNGFAARAKLDGFDVALFSERNRDDEIAVHVLAISGKDVGNRHFQDKIGTAELPCVSPVRRRREISSNAFAGAFGDP